MKPKNMEVALGNHISTSSNEKNRLIIQSKSKGNNVGNNNNNNGVIKTSIPVPSNAKKISSLNSEIMVNSSSSEALKTTSSTSSAEESLCDDILSCISALDEVIAEFDDSISQSSQSSSSSSQLAAATKSETVLLDSKIKETAIGMDSSIQNITQIQINGTSSSQPTTPTKTITKPSPIKPPRQTTSKSAITNSHRHESSLSSYIIESGNQNNQQISANSNISNSPTTYTSYGIIFPKKSSPSPQNPNVHESQLSASKCLTVTTQGSGSSIPVTFVVKNEAEIQRLKQNLEGENEMEKDIKEDEEEETESSGWNCYIERNLPRSLRNTRKTCFIEDEDDPHLKYPRSPKDYRKICDKEKTKNKQSPATATTATTEWIRTEHLIPSLKNGIETEPVQPLQPPILALRPDGPNGANGSSPNSDLIDDGYLSMINRPHDSPPWPEGFIESETFTPEELKRLSIPSQQELELVRGSQEKTDYFSDDSLEFEPPEQSRRQYGPIPQQVPPPQQQSFFIPFEPIPPIINMKASRKSWSPGSEVRLPTACGPAKNFINTNTWRKARPPSLIEEVEERSEKTLAAAVPVVKTRKPCAFFIPINDSDLKLGGTAKAEEKTENFAGALVGQLLETGIQEAASINALLDSTTKTTNSSDDLENISLASSSLDIKENEIISLNSRQMPKQRTNSSSSGIDYASSNPSCEDEEENDNFMDSLHPEIESSSANPKVLYEYIEDFHENPPPFIPPPPKEEIFTTSTPIMYEKDLTSPSPRINNDKPFPTNMNSSPVFPVDYIRKDNYGERILRTQRQASRSHENLLDINPRVPHPSVRRGHSATLPPNSIPPTTSKMNPFRQLLGIFRKNKNKSSHHNNHQSHETSNLSTSASSSIMDLPIYPTPTVFSTASSNEKYGSPLDYSYAQPNQFYYNHHRPSISESHGSQRSSISKTSSSKRSVLSRIFRRKEK